MKHLKLNGWLKTACGLVDDRVRDIAVHETEVDCKNCVSFVFAAMPVRAWNQCKPLSLRRYYLERAGLEPLRVEKIMRVGLWSAMSEEEQKKIERQMRDNPKLARLMGVGVLSIESGSDLDQRGKYKRVGFRGSFCSLCGGAA